MSPYDRGYEVQTDISSFYDWIHELGIYVFPHWWLSWTWSGYVCSNVCSYEAQMNVSALDDDCHELEVDLRALSDRSYEAELAVYQNSFLKLENLKWFTALNISYHCLHTSLSTYYDTIQMVTLWHGAISIRNFGIASMTLLIMEACKSRSSWVTSNEWFSMWMKNKKLKITPPIIFGKVLVKVPSETKVCSSNWENKRISQRNQDCWLKEPCAPIGWPKSICLSISE